MAQSSPTPARLHVLFDAHQLGRHQTGNETYVREVLGALRGRPGVQITAAVDASAADHPAVAPPHRRRPVPANGFLRLGALAIAARSTRPDVVHAIYFAPYLAGRPVVLTVHDISYELHPEFFSRSELVRNRVLIRDSTRRAQAVVTVSETSRQHLLQRYALPADRVIAIPNGVSSHFLAQSTRLIEPVGDRPVRILAVGTLQPRKNLMRLLGAIRLVVPRRAVQLRVVGPDGYQAGVIRDALGGAADVEIVGYVDDDRLAAEYRQADMLVYPSIYEGFGLPVVEAMACGLPVITSTGGALPEVAGDAAIVVDPFDEQAIADAILRLADDVDLRRSLSAAGRTRATEFSWAAAAERLVGVYRQVAGR